MAWDELDCNNNKFDECAKVNKSFYSKLNDLIQRVCDLGTCTVISGIICNGSDICKQAIADCLTPFINFPVGYIGASMTIGVPINVTPIPGVRALSLLSHQVNNVGYLSFTSGGIVVQQDGIYRIVGEIGTDSGGGYLESEIFVNGVGLGLEYPNSGSDATDNTLGNTFVHVQLNQNDLVQLGIGSSIGATQANLGNLTVVYERPI